MASMLKIESSVMVGGILTKRPFSSVFLRLDVSGLPAAPPGSAANYIVILSALRAISDIGSLTS